VDIEASLSLDRLTSLFFAGGLPCWRSAPRCFTVVDWRGRPWRCWCLITPPLLTCSCWSCLTLR